MNIIDIIVFICYYHHHGIFFTPWSLESWPAFSKRHPHPAFFSREVVVGPENGWRKTMGFFPQLGCWKKKSASTFKKISGLKSIFADEPWVPNGFFPCFEEWTLKKQGASTKVWVPMSPGWDVWSITWGSHWIGIPSGALNQCLLKILTDCSTSSEGKIKSPVANHWLHETRKTPSQITKNIKCTPPSLTY